MTHPFINKTETVQLVSISPAFAAELLTYNTHNRPQTQKHIDMYASTMKSGQWFNAVADVAFDINGVMQNGQHTLAGIIKSETTQIVCIKSGMPPEAIVAFDSGKPRTPGLRYALFTGEELNSDTVTTSNLHCSIARIMLIASNGFTNRRISYSDVFKHVTSNKATIQLVCHNIKEKGFRRSGILGAMVDYFIKSPIEADMFYNAVYGDGSGLTSNSPELKLREYIKDSDCKGGEAKQIEDYKKTLFCIHKFHNKESVLRLVTKDAWEF